MEKAVVNNMKRIKLLILSGLVLGTLVFTGCGKEEAESTEEPALTEETKEETPVDKKAQYEELYRENAVLWNDYCDLLMEVSYYEAPYREEILKEDRYVPASEKLKQPASENPKWLRPVIDFSSEVGEIEIPPLPESELDAAIAELTEQNATIKEETARLIPVRDSLKATYGLEMGIGDVEIAEPFEPVDEAELNAENESARPFEAAGSSSDSGSSTKSAGASTGGGTYNTSMTCEEMFKKAGWTIEYGSGDDISARQQFGQDICSISATPYGITVQFESLEYGELSGANAGCDTTKAREIVAYILNNGVNNFWYAGDFGLRWTPFN
jgi:hypothetical protein